MRQSLQRTAFCLIAVVSIASFDTGVIAKPIKLQTPHVSPTKLKQSCERGGGTYGTDTGNGSYYCSKEGGGVVICDTKTQKCDGYVPD